MPRGPLTALFLTVLVDLIGFGMVMPLLPFYATRYQANPGQVGLLVASFSFFQVIFAPFWGRLSDRLGRRPILMFSLAVSSMAYSLLAIAPDLRTVFLARSLAGIGAANIATAQAYVADCTSLKDRARGMGMIGAAFGLGFVLGPALGGLLYAVGNDWHPGWGLVLPALGASALSVTALVLAFLTLPEPDRSAHHAEDRLAHHHTTPGLLRLAVAVFFFCTLVFAGMETTIPLWLQQRFGYGGRENGYLFCFMGLVVVLVQGGLIRVLVARLGEARMVIFGCLCLLIGMLALPAIHNPRTLLGVVGLLALGQGTIHPGLMALISRLGGSNRHGGRLGMASAWSAVARILGPSAAGQAYQLAGPDSPYWAGGATMGLATLLALSLLAGLRHGGGEQVQREVA